MKAEGDNVLSKQMYYHSRQFLAQPFFKIREVGKVCMVERKFANRPGWSRILERSFQTAYFDEEDFKGYVTILKLEKVFNPLVKKVGEEEICIADNGYIWLQHYPQKLNYCITTMYNNDLEIVQWYFDIVKDIGVSEEGIPFFDDLYLDIVLLPNSKIFVLDENELENALINNIITKEEYIIANSELKHIIRIITSDKDKLTKFCNKYLEMMINLE